MAAAIIKCYECKELFRKEELIHYVPLGAQNGHNYCPKCLKNRQDRDKFSMKVCQIFGIKKPGPILWKQRLAKIKEYGFTDDIIIDCLDYVYNVEHKAKISETLVLVTPENVNRMLAWKKSEAGKAASIVNAASQSIVEHFVSIKENNKNNKQILNADDFLD